VIRGERACAVEGEEKRKREEESEEKGCVDVSAPLSPFEQSRSRPGRVCIAITALECTVWLRVSSDEGVS
jgi:hypothetical protein